MEPRMAKDFRQAADSKVVERCLLKWLHLSVSRFFIAESASGAVATLRLGIKPVNMVTQYVVDITARTHDIAPAL